MDRYCRNAGKKSGDVTDGGTASGWSVAALDEVGWEPGVLATAAAAAAASPTGNGNCAARCDVGGGKLYPRGIGLLPAAA